tara:strand:+ start:33520 stop:35688 length:2169 start_codon:yes stop_codon:yes gene_type:complete
MHRINIKMLTTLLFLFSASLSVVGQFTFKAKRANLTIKFSQTEGWTLSNQADNKTYLQFKEENAYIQIINNQLRVYTMSTGLWNTHPDAKFMDAIHIKSEKRDILANSNFFDSFSSFWISSAGGHLRIFKYPETIYLSNDKGINSPVHNKFVGNHLFLNQQKNSQISSTTSIFMISPSGNVFELDKGKSIWRFILKNRTLTSWSSDPPTDKMAFNIFSRDDFKQVISVGEKDNQYLFQVINHENKMGLASLSKDYFQVTIDVPPLFDFITPSIHINYHIIYSDHKLGVLYFLPQENKEEIPEFKTFYTPSKHLLFCDNRNHGSGDLLSDHNSFTITKKGSIYSSELFNSSINFGVEIINQDLLLYNEFSETKPISNSGLYRISQNIWYITPEQNLLKHYPEAIIQVQNTANENPISYSIYNSTGNLEYEDITSYTSPEFKHLASRVTQLPIDSITPIPSFTDSSFLFKTEDKWGVLTIKNENISIQLPANYQSITPFGKDQSLLLFNDGKFGWYGYPKNFKVGSPQLIAPYTTHFNLYDGNNLKQDETSSNTHYSAEIIGSKHVFNISEKLNNRIKQTAWVTDEMELFHELDAKIITPVHRFINVENKESIKMQLYSSNLKLVKTAPYDSIIYSENWVLLVSKKAINHINQNITSYPVIVDGFYGTKRLSFLKKYEVVYFYNDHFLAFKKNIWQVFNPDGQLSSKQVFPNYIAAKSYIEKLQ